MPSAINIKDVIAKVARNRGVLLEEDDPLFVALEAHAVVLQELTDQLLREIEDATEHLKTAVPGQVDAAMKASLETAAKAVRAGMDSDIEGASLKARAIVDSVYRAQSSGARWTWITVGLLAAAALFGCGMFVGHYGWSPR